jgi:hypothetical protein
MLVWYPQVVPTDVPGLGDFTPNAQKPRISGAFAKADEGIRTLDLRHGKATL